METRNLTVMFTDIKGFTARTSQSTREGLISMIKRHEAIVLPVAAEYGGRLIKIIGDAFLFTYESPTNAVLAGVAIQDALRSHNEEAAESDRIEVRVAINSGEVALLDDDVYGEPVNIAARIEGIAEPGEVYFTEAVYLSMNKAEVPSSEVGVRQLKGIPEQVRVFKVLREVPVGEMPLVGPIDRSGHSTVTAGGDTPAVAGLGRRFAATVIDVVLFALVFGFTVGLFVKDGEIFRATATPRTAEFLELAPTGSLYATPDTPVDASRSQVASATVEFSNFAVTERGWAFVGDQGAVLSGTEDGVFARAADGQVVRLEGDSTRIQLGCASGGIRVWIKMAMWVLYSAAFLVLAGATPGKLILSLRVTPVGAPGERLGVASALTRGIFQVLGLCVLLFGWIWALFNRRRHTWHDRLARSEVVCVGGDGPA